MESVKDTAVVTSVGSLTLARMKFKNGDVSLDDAVQDILGSGEKFACPNSDLLLEVIDGMKWD